MSHNEVDFVFHAGNRRVLQFTVYDEDAANPGKPDLTSPVDLSGASEIEWGLADHPKAAAPLVLKTLTGGKITVTGTNNNELNVQLENADTVNLAGKYYHEAKVTEPAGDEYTVANGVMRIKATILD